MNHSPDPGLDMTALRALRGTRRDLGLLLHRIEAHLDQHDGYLAFSGGKDSLVVLHLALQVDPSLPVAWFDSGLEFPETRTFIDDLTKQWGLNLEIVPAQPTALDVLVASGRWDHFSQDHHVPDLHQVMILDPARRAHDLFGPGEMWGVRAQESRGRRHLFATQLHREIERSCAGCCPAGASPNRQQRLHHGGVLARTDGTVAYSPIWDWSTEEVWSYLAKHDVPTNPVYDRLRTLGVAEASLRVAHLVDANAVQYGRMTWLKRGWPALFAELATELPRLEELV